MTSRRSVRLAGLLVAALLAGAVAISLRGHGGPPPASPPAAVSTARVMRGALTSSVLTAGTLGYGAAGPLVNELTGTFTSLPHSGAVIAAGAVIYRVDNAAAFLMAGTTPAWRVLAIGISDGPDIAELQSDLVSLGYARGLLAAATGHFDLATLDAVERWQAAKGLTLTGSIPLGEMIFLPAPVRIGAVSAALGTAAAPGDRPVQITTTRRAVIVPLTPTLPPVRAGERVEVLLPSGAATAGLISDVGQAREAGAGGSGPAALTVIPLRPAATGSGAGIAVEVRLPVQSVRRALTVPVSALLALAGGGYGLEIVEANGRHRLVGVRVGLFAGSTVQVSGEAVDPGTRVVVAQ